MKNIAVVLASGTGERFGENIPKQFYKFEGKTILEHSLDAFEQNKNIDEIILVTNPQFRDLAEDILKNNDYKKISKVLNGGKTRVESSYIGTSAADNNSNVLIHDAVRAFVTQKIINDNVEALKKYQAVGTAIDTVDTIIQVDEDNIITNIPQRKSLKRVQTPQSFRVELIQKAHKLAMEDKNVSFTDDCGLILKYNLAPIHIVEGDEINVKITQKDDLEVIKNILAKRNKNG
ncbi:2-C-methyl-D-erythritol 4-phosphate cytidylyltransferase [bacterium]|nr:2-C-methyl-D-erythritol 4-phosphate cytidylyltransferase [bacterium]